MSILDRLRGKQAPQPDPAQQRLVAFERAFHEFMKAWPDIELQPVALIQVRIKQEQPNGNGNQQTGR